MEQAHPKKKHLELLEFAAVIMLSFTTILTAWSAFQAAKWGGVQSANYATGAAYRAESLRASTRAGQQAIVDAQTFLSWSQAVANGQTDLANFYQERFRDEFKVAVDAWVATDPLNDPDAPPTPFDMAEYVRSADVESQRLAGLAEAEAASALQANDRADNYIALTILFAGVLFFVGVSTRFESFPGRLALVSLGACGMFAGVVILLIFPVDL